MAEYSSQVQQWAARVQQLEAAAAAGPASSSADAVARLAALQQQASEAEVQVTSLQAENRALREQVRGGGRTVQASNRAFHPPRTTDGCLGSPCMCDTFSRPRLSLLWEI